MLVKTLQLGHDERTIRPLPLLNLTELLARCVPSLACLCELKSRFYSEIMGEKAQSVQLYVHDHKSSFVAPADLI